MKLPISKNQKLYVTPFSLITIYVSLLFGVFHFSFLLTDGSCILESSSKIFLMLNGRIIENYYLFLIHYIFLLFFKNDKVIKKQH